MSRFRHRRCAWVLAATMAAGAIQAQDYSAHGPWPPGMLGSVQLLSGGSTLERYDLFPEDFRQLTPGSTLVPEELSGYGMRRGEWFFDAAPAFLIALGLHPFHNGEKPGPELRAGIHHASGTAGTLGWSRTDRVPVDTLYSTGGQYFVVDSTRSEEYQYRHQAERLGVEAAIVFRTSGPSRWSLFGGGGVGAGAVLNARTTVRHTVTTDVSYPYGSASRHTHEEREQRYRNQGGGWVTVQTVLGFAFRLARQGDFLRRMDLCFELRPQTITRFGGDLGSSISFGSQQMLGLRVRLYSEP
ncbi:MAG: hypothetical protein KIT10_12290 [Flavobacteriales bacterium]|nr:hypothetical protein [Flavobacteriales bacterium]